jgi:hypothetical protein
MEAPSTTSRTYKHKPTKFSYFGPPLSQLQDHPSLKGVDLKQKIPNLKEKDIVKSAQQRLADDQDRQNDDTIDGR